MKEREYFTYQEVPNSTKVIIVPIFEHLPLEHTSGSFAILPARIMGLSYANYLRMCRDVCGAEIIGKGTMYPTAYFKKDKFLFTFIRTLNAKTRLIITNQNIRKQEQLLKEKEKGEQ